MLFDPSFVMAHPGQIALLVFLIFVGKSLIIGGLARAFGYGNMAPWIIGLGLSQIGEFSFVLARTGVSAGALSKPIYNLALTCTILTMALSPLVSGAALPMGRTWRRWRKPPPNLASVELPRIELQGHVIVAGYGRSGRAVARVLRDAGIRFVVTEWDHAAFSDVNAQGHPAVWGDIAQEPILHGAYIENARVIVLTVPDQGTIRLSAQRARKMNPSIIVIARAMRERNVVELRELGINATVQPEFEGGIEMVRQALVPYNYDEIEVARLISNLRSDLYGETH
jgi:CPA2 family monovalent cation:H+ antiporter-2